MQGNHSDCSKWPNMPGSGIYRSCQVRFLGTCQTCSLNHLVSSQESVKIRSACMAPRASTIKEQGFSKAVAVGIEAQRGSTRSVIADNWVCHQFQHNENLARLLDSLQ